MYRNYNASLSKASSITEVSQCRGGAVSSFSVIGKHGHWRASLASMLTSTGLSITAAESSRAEPSCQKMGESSSHHQSRSGCESPPSGHSVISSEQRVYTKLHFRGGEKKTKKQNTSVPNNHSKRSGDRSSSA